MTTQGRSNEPNRGTRQGEAFGIASISNVLVGIHFPITKQELINRFGNHEIRFTKESQPMRLRDLLQKVPKEQFSSVTEITQTVGDLAERGVLSR